MADILNTALSGLRASQRALATTSNNIANVNTEGYSRQRVQMAQQNPQFTPAGYIGNGVQVTGIDRIYDQFVVAQMREAGSEESRLDTFASIAGAADELFGDSASGLDAAMQQFFASLNDVANYPSDSGTRTAFLQDAEGLARQFNFLDRQLENIGEQITGTLQGAVSEINDLSESIAKLNTSIAQAEASGVSANGLRDERDVKIQELARQVSIQTLEQDDGSVSIFVGGAMGLVMGDTAGALTVEFDPSGEPTFKLDGQMDLTSRLAGGVIGGALDAKNELVDPARSDLRDMAIDFAQDFNTLHESGVDLDGNSPANALFTLAGPGLLEVAISDPRQIAAAQAGGGATDNRNMLALADLENAALGGSTETLGESYSGLVGFVGSVTRQNAMSLEAQSAVMGQLEARREAISGVNLDEEAADLIRYQQAYQAMSRTVSVADTLFQSLLNAV